MRTIRDRRCEYSGKRSYGMLAEAEEAAEYQVASGNAESLRAYLCYACGDYHLTKS